MQTTSVPQTPELPAAEGVRARLRYILDCANAASVGALHSDTFSPRRIGELALGAIVEYDASVAELIEAAQAHNEACDEYAVSYGSEADVALGDKISARDRLDTALARVGGAP